MGTVLDELRTSSPYAGQRFDPTRLDQWSRDSGIDPFTTRAIEEVESSGSAYFVEDGTLKVLPEPSLLWALTKGTPMQDAAVRAGVAWEHWDRSFYNKVRTPAERHDFLDRMAAATSEEMAIRACSWGGFQICGHYYQLCGYRSASEMVLDWHRNGEDVQTTSFITWLISKNLTGALQASDYQQIAYTYNGSGQAAAYAAKMHAAHDRLARAEGAPNVVPDSARPTPPVFAMLRLGSSGEDVRDIQSKLFACGQKLNVSGSFDQTTKNAVCAFQAQHNDRFGEPLKADGLVGEKTRWAIDNAAISDRTYRDPASDTPVAPSKSAVADPKDEVASHAKGAAVTAGLGAVGAVGEAGLSTVNTATSTLQTANSTVSNTMYTVQNTARTANEVARAGQTAAPALRTGWQKVEPVIVNVALPMFSGVLMTVAAFFAYKAFLAYKAKHNRGQVLA